MKTSKSPTPARRFWHWLHPDAPTRRYFPAILLAIAPPLYLAVSGIDYALTCHHYPDISGNSQKGLRYECQDPVWTVTCSETLRGETTDVCFRRFSHGITFINHFKSTLELECKSSRGNSTYINGSEGCVCSFREDDGGRCVDSATYCKQRYGESAFPDIVADHPEKHLETLAADESRGRYGVCRCPDNQQFNVQTSRCR